MRQDSSTVFSDNLINGLSDRTMFRRDSWSLLSGSTLCRHGRSRGRRIQTGSPLCRRWSGQVHCCPVSWLSFLPWFESSLKQYSSSYANSITQSVTQVSHALSRLHNMQNQDPWKKVIDILNRVFDRLRRKKHWKCSVFSFTVLCRVGKHYKKET